MPKKQYCHQNLQCCNAGYVCASVPIFLLVRQLLEVPSWAPSTIRPKKGNHNFDTPSVQGLRTRLETSMPRALGCQGGLWPDPLPMLILTYPLQNARFHSSGQILFQNKCQFPPISPLKGPKASLYIFRFLFHSTLHGSSTKMESPPGSRLGLRFRG